MTEDQQKLKAFGRIKEGEPLSNLVSELGVPYPKLLKWKKELQEAEKEGTIHQLINVNEVLLEGALESVQHELVNLVTTPEDVEAMQQAAASVSKGLTGLSLLNTQLQDAASLLTRRITALAMGALEPREIQQLASSLSQLQTSFFNKQGTQIAILNNGNDTSKPLSDFKRLMKD